MNPCPKQTTHRDKDYLKFIRSKGCVICSRKAIAHHEQITHRGIGTKCSDYETIPLCEECHKKRHNMGKYWFWSRHFFSRESRGDYLKEQEILDFCLAKMIIGFLSEYIQNR